MDDYYEGEFISKSERKRQMDALLNQTEALLKLSDTDIALLNLGEPLEDLLKQAKVMPKTKARKRQLKYIRSQLAKMPDEVLLGVHQRLSQKS